MKALVANRPLPIEEGPLSLQDVPIPTPTNHEVRVKVSTCGVCLTDYQIVTGQVDFPNHSVTPGHQIVGVIDMVGNDVTHLRVGQRVGIFWLHESCNDCDFCGQGRENLCRDAKFTGYDEPGGYAEYALANANYVVPIPEGLTDEKAAPLLCAGGTGYRSYKLSEIQPGQKLGLFGFGGAAHLMIQVANHFRCEVYAFSRSLEHQKLARELGAVWAGDPKDDPGSLLHSAIIFAPAGEVLPLALERIDRGGVVAFNAIHASDIPLMKYREIYYEKTIRSVSHVTRADVQEFMRLAAEIPIQPKVTIFKLEEANEALAQLSKSQVQGMAVLKVH